MLAAKRFRREMGSALCVHRRDNERAPDRTAASRSQSKQTESTLAVALDRDFEIDARVAFGEERFDFGRQWWANHYSL